MSRAKCDDGREKRDCCDHDEKCHKSHKVPRKLTAFLLASKRGLCGSCAPNLFNFVTPPKEGDYYFDKKATTLYRYDFDAALWREEPFTVPYFYWCEQNNNILSVTSRCAYHYSCNEDGDKLLFCGSRLIFGEPTTPNTPTATQEVHIFFTYINCDWIQFCEWSNAPVPIVN